MREKEKRKRAESFSQKKKKTFLISEPLTVSSLGNFIVKPPLKNYKNNIEKSITIGAKREENHKSQKAKTGSMKEQWLEA